MLLLLALAAGVAVPLAHLTARWAFRRYLRKIEEEKAAAAAATGDAGATGNRNADGDASA